MMLSGSVMFVGPVWGGKWQGWDQKVEGCVGVVNKRRVRPVAVSTISLSSVDVVVVGAGVSGLAAAHELLRYGVVPRVLEAQDGVGGRMRTDVVDGFQLDRGFHVFIPGYPKQKQILDYSALNLCPFEPGALVRDGSNFFRVSDPLRRPERIPESLANPIGSFTDKLRLGLLRWQALGWSVDNLTKPQAQRDHTEYFLREVCGFSDSMILKFFTPFYRGIFLAELSEQSSAMFRFLFKMFAESDGSLPAGGIGSVAAQMAANLPEGAIELNTSVTGIDNGGCHLKLNSGQALTTKFTIIATDGPEASRLTFGRIRAPEGRSSTCLYFSIPGTPPISDPLLLLNGNGIADGPINNICFPNNIAPSYAPRGQSLASITVTGDGFQESAIEQDVRAQLVRWFGHDEVSQWDLIRTYQIRHAQPSQRALAQRLAQGPALEERVFVCGDHWSTPTVNGAIDAGQSAARAVIAALAN
mmetsp:Transcript_9978/g.20233  ORF Transcript_9978/g.20233 Transcript_9978/m.20233 type:complete len:471 (-) Transcript_9978:1126-2538(-)|eukprot:CAMPEP_0184678044 /NCGR_PEP_ID=MMETSP0312-20130426/668_1 /TAXON_ID=31354 /ORGANISM="Compsopogon coeruleus, Strain SAG 36.94" /LENGTH=470 /DNA_ID=CAMNT_0027126365 /DNA_START=404 /DNA_END=1816 /DNA_ORIENTATION=-